MCVEFIKRIPDVFREPFTPGTGSLPNANSITATTIIDYINRALQDFYGEHWKGLGADPRSFLRYFPEMQKTSDNLTLTAANYTIATPHLDLGALIGAITKTSGKYIKAKDSDLYMLYLSEEYDQFLPTANDPAIIHAGNVLAVFPQTFTDQIKIHYIPKPVDPTTGGFLTQNGSYDSPFDYHWNKFIVDMAYLKYLEETNQTS